MSKEEELKTAIEFLSSLPKKELAHPADHIYESGYLKCFCNKKQLKYGEHEHIQTPYVRGLSRVCDECKKEVKGMCPVMCVGCREIIAFLPPDKDDDGFERKPNYTYHVKHCPQCAPEKHKNRESCCILAEKAVFLKNTKNVPLNRWE